MTYALCMYVMVVWLGVLVGLRVGEGVSLILLPSFWICFFIVGCLVQPYYEGIYLVL